MLRWLLAVAVLACGCSRRTDAVQNPQGNQQARHVPVAAPARARAVHAPEKPRELATVEIVAAATQRGAVADAVQVVREACEGLVSVWSDVESARATVGDVGDFMWAGPLGWRRVVEVAVVIRTDVKSPKLAELRAGGETLRFTVGAGRRAGVWAEKEAAKALCGMSAPSGSSGFLAVPAARKIRL